jgi:hypothetical protein
MPSFLVALLASLCLLLLKFIPDLPPYVVFSMQVLMMLILAVVFGRFFRLEGYIEIRNIITEKVPWLDRYL